MVLHFSLNRKGAENLRWKKKTREQTSAELDRPFELYPPHPGKWFWGHRRRSWSPCWPPLSSLTHPKGSDWEPRSMNPMKCRGPVSFSWGQNIETDKRKTHRFHRFHTYETRQKKILHTDTSWADSVDLLVYFKSMSFLCTLFRCCFLNIIRTFQF